MKRSKVNLILLGLMTTLVATCFQVGFCRAASWRVEQDGSGDFATIQPAVDASAPGDTILIGPGNYTEATRVHPSGWAMSTDAFVSVIVDDLTFIGSSPEEVVIGPESYYSFNSGIVGFLFADAQGTLRVENVTVHNVSVAIWSLSNRVEAVNCHYIDIEMNGIFSKSSSGLLLEQCSFNNNDYALAAFAPCSGIVIRDCEFTACGISLQDNDDVVIEGCDFQGGEIGIQFHRSTGIVDSCEFYGHGTAGIGAIGGSGVSITNSFLRGISGFNNGSGLIAASSSIVSLENCVLDGDHSSMQILSSSFVSANGCNFERSGNWFIWSNNWNGPITEFDFTLNYWGTTDLEEIAAGIIDHNDLTELGFVINFDPVADVIQATDSISLDGLKALFR